MLSHKGHSILGNYCWTCQRPTLPGVPGWTKPSKSDGPVNNDGIITSVVWADGLEDVSRECILCKTTACKSPVHKEQYVEI